MSENVAVEAVIAIHDSSRPLQRAIDSLLESGLEVGRELRITVVCHNVDPGEIASTLTDRVGAAVSLVALNDGIRSPAGPFNLGISSSSAEFVSIMGSDDYLEPGALAAWLSIARSGSYAAVIAPQRHASGAVVRTPPVRPFHRGNRDPVKDRLAYRTAPLGLIRRSIVDTLGLEFSRGFATGEDQLFSAKLWFSGAPVAYARREPRYVVGADASDRVTMQTRPMSVEFEAIDAFISSEWYLGQSTVVREAIATKIVRVHVFSAASTRSEAAEWSADDRAYVAQFLRRVRDVAPACERALSIADRRLVDALGSESTPAEQVAKLVIARRRFGHPATLITRDARSLLAVEAPVRFSLASALI